MPKIILCRGIQGSGKTTWAKQWVLEDPEHRVRFNNDDIRNMLGKYWVPSREPIITTMKNSFISGAAIFRMDVVIDNMNLNSKELDYWKDIARMFNYDLEIKNFFTPLQDCIERDSKRPNPVGEEVIRKTYEKYKDILKV
nr:MAG TPA: polynucleotide kinase [Crassvirales sp.]